MIKFTENECFALLQLLEDASGGNASDVFAWDGHDDPGDVGIRVAVKIFKACGCEVPDNLQERTDAS